ncbi:hypothetical protein AB0M95_26100 [Sphaerisporangium sp. NPDC051017]|uniref:hypothetical protein n=1 Tax=Sphaerisporangium sp. NPDC051017 TaxID=3154636 RepID=UPI003415CA8C
MELRAENATLAGYHADEIRVGEALKRLRNLTRSYSDPVELLVGDWSAIRPGRLWGKLSLSSGNGHAEDQNHGEYGAIDLRQNAEAFLGEPGSDGVAIARDQAIRTSDQDPARGSKDVFDHATQRRFRQSGEKVCRNRTLCIVQRGHCGVYLSLATLGEQSQ